MFDLANWYDNIICREILLPVDMITQLNNI